MKKTGALLFAMLLAAMVFASAPAVIDKKLCRCPKPIHGKCLMDSLSRTKPAITTKKADTQAKKVCKTEPKSIFSTLFSIELPTTAIEDFFLSAQKVLIEKFS